MSKRMIGIIAVAILLDPLGLQSVLPVTPTSDTPDESGSSRSRSRQFVIHGKDGHTRGAFCVFCEEVKTEVLDLLGQPDRWRLPIVLQLKGHTSDLVPEALIRPKIYSLVGGGFRLQADVEISSGFSAQLLRKEIIRLVLAELILRPHPKVNLKGGKSILPEWLSVGVIEAIEYRRKGRPTRLFSSIVKSKNIVSLTDIIFAGENRKNSISSEIYRASCCCLVMALLGRDSGPMKMGRMINDLAVSRGSPKALIEKHFPEISNLEKWWLLELAAMARPTVKDILDPLESEHALKESLRVRYIPSREDSGAAAVVRKRPKRLWNFLRRGRTTVEYRTKETVPEDADFVEVDISEYRRFMGHPERADLLDDIEVKLLHLSYRAFPLHRPMIQDYQVILALIAKGKVSGIDDRLAELAAARAELAGLAGEATDYINWYEATQVERRSGAFAEYKSVFDDLHRPLPPRRDRLSQYLDQLDKEFLRP